MTMSDKRIRIFDGAASGRMWKNDVLQRLGASSDRPTVSDGATRAASCRNWDAACTGGKRTSVSITRGHRRRRSQTR